MNFQFDEAPQLLADSLGKLVDHDYGFEARKAILASADGRSSATWRAMAEMGILSLNLSEEAGGFAMGVLDCVPVMEQIGRGLLVEPVVDNMLCARVLDRCGGQSQHELLGQLTAGDALISLAHLESDMGDDSRRVALRAKRAGDQWQLDGRKEMVVHAATASHLLVSARTAGEPGDADGVSLFLVSTEAGGLTMNTMRTVDNFRAADVRFNGCRPLALIGEAGKGLGVLEEAIDFATLLLCAEAVGIMGFTNETTLEYLKTRKQFGVSIGTFQALQHRMVDLVISAEQARSIVYLACDALDKAASDGTPGAEASRRKHVSAAKIKVSDAARHIGQEAIQLHGGMGMTNEMKVSHAFKRLTVIAQLHGDTDHHLARFAAADR